MTSPRPKTIYRALVLVILSLWTWRSIMTCHNVVYQIHRLVFYETKIVDIMHITRSQVTHIYPYLRQQSEPSLLQITAWRLFGTKPLFFILWKWFQNVVYKTTAILFWSQYVKTLGCATKPFVIVSVLLTCKTLLLIYIYIVKPVYNDHLMG